MARTPAKQRLIPSGDPGDAAGKRPGATDDAAEVFVKIAASPDSTRTLIGVLQIAAGAVDRGGGLLRHAAAISAGDAPAEDTPGERLSAARQARRQDMLAEMIRHEQQGRGRAHDEKIV